MEMPGGFDRLGKAGKGSSDGRILNCVEGLGLRPCLGTKSTKGIWL